MSVALVVALFVTACGDPVVPLATSDTAELIQATVEPEPTLAIPTPVPSPVPAPTSQSGQPEPTPRPVAAQGLSSDSITVAVIFDDETAGVADNLFRDAWLGALAWQKSVNDAGGLGGRLINLVPLDSQLFNHRSAIESVCQGDYFAIIGSHSLSDFEGAELLGTEDCNIPDFSGAVYGSRRAASPVTFLSNPFLNDIRQAGPARYLVEKYPDASENLGLFYYRPLDLLNATERQREMLEAQGMNVVFQLAPEFEEDPTERLKPRWEELGAESLVWTADPGRLIEFLEALDEPPVFTLCEWGCYSQQFISRGGEAVEGVYAWIPHSPFDSSNARGDLFVYLLTIQSVAPEAGWSEVGFQSWLAGRLFEAAFNRLLVVEPEAPTREKLITVARGIDFYTANNVLSPTNPAAGEPTPCFALMVVRNGRWEQEYPTPPRDQDCAEENIYRLTSTLALGLEPEPSALVEDPVTDESEEPDLESPETLDE